jgi:hypothetical protein
MASGHSKQTESDQRKSDCLTLNYSTLPDNWDVGDPNDKDPAKVGMMDNLGFSDVVEGASDSLHYFGTTSGKKPRNGDESVVEEDESTDEPTKPIKRVAKAKAKVKRSGRWK